MVGKEGGVSMKSINIKGKEYVEVHERIKYFRENFPDHTLSACILQLSSDRVMMKATINAPIKTTTIVLTY